MMVEISQRFSTDMRGVPCVGDSLRDLQSFKRRAHYKAGRGRHGEGAQRHGADGDDLRVLVPPGTVVTFEDEVLAWRRTTTLSFAMTA